MSLVKDTYVYSVLGLGNVPIYTGVTDNLQRRKKQHAKDSSWWHLVEKINIKGPFHRTKALDVEKSQIKDLKPKFNVINNPSKESHDLSLGVRLAVKRAGTQQKLANALSVTRGAVSLWKCVPLEHCPAIEIAYGVPVENLRPDVFTAQWLDIRNKQAA